MARPASCAPAPSAFPTLGTTALKCYQATGTIVLGVLVRGELLLWVAQLRAAAAYQRVEGVRIGAVGPKPVRGFEVVRGVDEDGHARTPRRTCRRHASWLGHRAAGVALGDRS
jgi:hypothetical protein